MVGGGQQQCLLTEFFGGKSATDLNTKRKSKQITKKKKIKNEPNHSDTSGCSQGCDVSYNKLSENELDCVGLIKTFLKSGMYARTRLTQVIGNIWIHYQIENPKRRNTLLRLAKFELATKAFLGSHAADETDEEEDYEGCSEEM